MLLGDAPPAPAPSASSIVTCFCFLAPHRCGSRGLTGTWPDVYGFIKPPDSDERWRVRQHGAFPILHEALAIRAATTRYGSTWILWSGAAVNHITKETFDEFFERTHSMHDYLNTRATKKKGSIVK